MKIVCASLSCKYSSKNEDSSNVIFISFPNDDTSTVWAHNCGRPDLMIKSNEELHKNYYICADHIEDRYFISKTSHIIIAQGAIPTLFQMNDEHSPQHFEPSSTEHYSSDHINTLNLDNCIVDVNSTCSSEYVSSTDVNYQNTPYNPELQDTTNHINEMSRSEKSPVDLDDNNHLNLCNINLNIDQLDDMTIRFTNLCRICGQGSPEGLDIFSDKGVELKLVDKIHLHLPIFMKNDGSMSQRMCENCYEKLELSHLLFVTCLRTDIRMRKSLNLPSKYNNERKFCELISNHELEINNEMYTDPPTVEELPIPQTNPASNSPVNEEVSKDSNSHAICTQETQSVIQCTESTLLSSKMDTRFRFILQQSDFNNIILQPLQNMYSVSSDKAPNNSSNPSTSDNVPRNLIINKDSKHLILVSNNRNNNIERPSNSQIEDVQKGNVVSDCSAVNSNDSIYDGDKSCDDNSKVPYNNDDDGGNKEEFRCKKCNSIFLNQSKLMQHELIHTKDILSAEQRRCGHCSLPFHNRKSLQTHILDKHSGQQVLFMCGLCDKIYEKWSSLDVHEATHRQDKPYLCDLCGKSFKHSNNLRGHKRIHLDITKKKRHVCELCGNAFRSRFHLKEHMNQHNGNKPYVCEQCGKAFSKRIQLRQHRLSHGLNKYACPICGVTFNRRGNMNTHIKRHSNNDGMYTCSVCESRCKSMSELKQHRKQHSEADIMESIKKKCNNKPAWECKVCSRVFPKRGTLLNHERTHEGTQIRIECDKCGKKLSSKSSLKYHIKSVHTLERPHMCQFCGDVFISKDARLIHERIHTGERPYSCKLCSMQYRCSSHLSQHMKVHSTVRPHACHYCNKSFARKGSLTVHERIHTDIKPFVCNICDKTFSQKHDMTKHAKIHQTKTFCCEDCNEFFTTKTEIFKHFESSHKSNCTGFFSNSDADGNEKMDENVEACSLNKSENVKETDELR